MDQREKYDGSFMQTLIARATSTVDLTMGPLDVAMLDESGWPSSKRLRDERQRHDEAEHFHDSRQNRKEK